MSTDKHTGDPGDDQADPTPYNYGCRCAECVEAKHTYHRKAHERALLAALAGAYEDPALGQEQGE